MLLSPSPPLPSHCAALRWLHLYRSVLLICVPLPLTLASLVLVPPLQLYVWLVVPLVSRSPLDPSSTTGGLTGGFALLLLQYFLRLHHALRFTLRSQRVNGYIFGTAWLGFLLNLVSYIVCAHVSASLALTWHSFRACIVSTECAFCVPRLPAQPRVLHRLRARESFAGGLFQVSADSLALTGTSSSWLGPFPCCPPTPLLHFLLCLSRFLVLASP